MSHILNSEDNDSYSECNYNYGVLAAAIIESADKDKDLEFLESDWCDDLRFMAEFSQNHEETINHGLGYYLQEPRIKIYDPKGVRISS